MNRREEIILNRITAQFSPSGGRGFTNYRFLLAAGRMQLNSDEQKGKNLLSLKESKIKKNKVNSNRWQGWMLSLKTKEAEVKSSSFLSRINNKPGF